MHNIHDNHHDTFHDHHDPRLDRCAPDCDDQLPVIANMSRGLKGDSFKVLVHDDTDGLSQAELEDMFKNPETAKNFNFGDETFVEGVSYDEATKQWTSEWMSENINGGRLHYQYNLRPYTIPQTFTITFIYRRPGRPVWSWTTPAIPYMWDVNGDGEPDVDGIVGAGIANLFVREGINADWVQTERHGSKTPVPPNLESDEGRWGQINWPEGTYPKDFNGVAPTEAWASTVTFGYGGDVELPNLDDIAKILGWDREDIENVLDDVDGALDGSDNVKDYIDDNLKALETKIYIDLGFGDGPFELTVKQYIDNSIEELRQEFNTQIENLTQIINQMGNKHDQTLADIINKIYGGGTVNEDGTVTWNTSGKAAVGDLNVFAGTASPVEGTVANSLRSRSLSDNDIKAV